MLFLTPFRFFTGQFCAIMPLFGSSVLSDGPACRRAGWSSFPNVCHFSNNTFFVEIYSFVRWSNQLSLQHEVMPRLSTLQLPLRINKLYNLPEQIFHLVNMIEDFKSVKLLWCFFLKINIWLFRCPETGEVTNAVPTMCLNCGTLLCKLLWGG